MLATHLLSHCYPLHVRYKFSNVTHVNPVTGPVSLNTPTVRNIQSSPSSCWRKPWRGWRLWSFFEDTRKENIHGVNVEGRENQSWQRGGHCHGEVSCGHSFEGRVPQFWPFPGKPLQYNGFPTQYSRDGQLQTNWYVYYHTAEPPWVRFWGPKIVPSSCTYLGPALVMKVINIDI